MSGDGVDRWSDEVVNAVAEAIRAEDESGGFTYRELARAALAVIPEPPAATPAPPEADRACETLERNQRPEIVVLCGVDQRWPVIVARWPDGFTPEAPSAGVDRWSDEVPPEHPCAGACRGCGADPDGACVPPCRCDEGEDCAAARAYVAGWSARAALAVIPEAPAAERADGFAGYDGCPSAPCRGERASLCAAAGDCADLALRARVFGPPAPPEADSAGEMLERIRQIVGEVGIQDHELPAHVAIKRIEDLLAAPTPGEGEAHA